MVNLKKILGTLDVATQQLRIGNQQIIPTDSQSFYFESISNRKKYTNFKYFLHNYFETKLDTMKVYF